MIGSTKLRLDELCEVVNGGSWNESEYTESGIPVLKVSNFNSNSFDLNNISHLSEKDSAKYAKHCLKQGDLIIATVGSHQSLVNSAAGRTIAVSLNVSGFYLNQNAVCVRTKDSNKLDQSYLSYLGESGHFRNYIQVRGKGAANQMRIAIGDIKSFPVNLPTLPTQQKIAHILSAYDDLIENNMKRIKLLEEMAQITYEQWFMRMKFPRYKTTPIDAETGLPELWKRSELKQYIKFIKGKKITSTQSLFSSGAKKINLLGSLDSGKYKYTLDQNQVTVHRGDLLMLMDGARSSWVFYAEDGVVGSTMATIKVKEIPVSLLYQFFKTYIGWLVINNTGAAIPHANKSFINKIQFVVPEAKILGKWITLINPINKSIWNFKDQNQILKEARDFLLPRLMTGMINVDQIELPIPEQDTEAS